MSAEQKAVVFERIAEIEAAIQKLKEDNMREEVQVLGLSFTMYAKPETINELRDCKDKYYTAAYLLEHVVPEYQEAIEILKEWTNPEKRKERV